MQGGGRIASLAGSIADTRLPRTARRSQALLRLPSGKEYVMSNGIAAGLGLASLVGLAAALPLDQSGPARPGLPAATAPGMPLAAVRSQVDPARGRIWSLTGAGLSLQDGAKRPPITLALPGWH